MNQDSTIEQVKTLRPQSGIFELTKAKMRLGTFQENSDKKWRCGEVHECHFSVIFEILSNPDELVDYNQTNSKISFRFFSNGENHLPWRSD